MSIYLQEINNAKITGILFLLQFFITTILTLTHHTLHILYLFLCLFIFIFYNLKILWSYLPELSLTKGNLLSLNVIC